MNRSHSLEMIVKQLKHSGSIKAHIVSCGGLKMQKFLLAESYEQERMGTLQFSCIWNSPDTRKLQCAQIVG